MQYVVGRDEVSGKTKRRLKGGKSMTRNKPVITATVSPMARRQLAALVGGKQLFASQSDAIDQAIGILYYTVKTKAC